MNKWLIAVALGLAMGGCAEGVDEPLPPGPTAPAPNPPSQSTLAGDLPSGQATTVDFEKPPLFLEEPSIGPIPEPVPEPAPGK